MKLITHIHLVMRSRIGLICLHEARRYNFIFTFYWSCTKEPNWQGIHV